jgi:hypothetical protein
MSNKPTPINTVFIAECAAFLMNNGLVEFHEGKASISDEGYSLLFDHTKGELTETDVDAIEYLIDNGKAKETFESFAERLNLRAAVIAGINEYGRLVA